MENGRKTAQKIIMATAISGCGEKEYLARAVECCGKLGKKVKVYNVWDVMRETAAKISVRLNPDNIMNADPYFRKALRLAAFEQIDSEIKNDSESDAVIISMHASLYWETGFEMSYDRSRKMFAPDMYFAHIEGFRHILASLKSKSQWRDQKLSEKDVLTWQDVEVGITKAWAEEDGKPFFCVPSSPSQSPSLLYKLIFRPDVKLLYPGNPISHFQDPEDRKEIDEIIADLDERFAVISPLAVEIIDLVQLAGAKNEELPETMHAINNHIVLRDEEWLLSQCDIMVAFWPTRKPPEAVRQNEELLKEWPEEVTSHGTDHETHTAIRRTLEVWTIYTGKGTSPFVTRYKTKFFTSKKAFRKFLDEKHPKLPEFSR